jgi:hypothetical protein
LPISLTVPPHNHLSYEMRKISLHYFKSSVGMFLAVKGFQILLFSGRRIG